MGHRLVAFRIWSFRTSVVRDARFRRESCAGEAHQPRPSVSLSSIPSGKTLRLWPALGIADEVGQTVQVHLRGLGSWEQLKPKKDSTRFNTLLFLKFLPTAASNRTKKYKKYKKRLKASRGREGMWGKARSTKLRNAGSACREAASDSHGGTGCTSMLPLFSTCLFHWAYVEFLSSWATMQRG